MDQLDRLDLDRRHLLRLVDLLDLVDLVHQRDLEDQMDQMDRMGQMDQMDLLRLEYPIYRQDLAYRLGHCYRLYQRNLEHLAYRRCR